MGNVALTLADYSIIAAMLTTVTMWHWRWTVGQMRIGHERIKGVSDRVKSMEVGAVRIQERIDAIEREKTDRREWAREAVSTRTKLDQLHAELSKIEGKLDTNWGVAAAVRQLSDVLGRRQEEATK